MADYNNSYVKLQKAANGRAGVKLSRSTLSNMPEGKEYYGRVTRYTLTPQNVIDAMIEEIPNVSAGTIASVLNAHNNVLLKSLKNGNAVKFGELGTFYIAVKGAQNGEEKPDLTVRFSTTSMLRESVAELTIEGMDVSTGPSIVFKSITDVSDATKNDGEINPSGPVLITGTGLKVGGKDTETDFGVWFAPVAENGEASTDENMWIKVEGAFTYNTPSKLLFPVPPYIVAGKRYRLVIRTHYCGSSGYYRKNYAQGVSDIISIKRETSNP